MRTFARFTSGVFIVLGLMLILLGGLIVFGGILRLPNSGPSASNLVPYIAGLSAVAGAIAGGVVAFQGLLLVAVGQVLGLLAGMADEAKTSNRYLEELVNRMGNAARR